MPRFSLLIFPFSDFRPIRGNDRRQRRAEKLRREYERVGDEQNIIFESLAEYTHGVQADVRALQIERDQLITTDSTLTAAHRRSGTRQYAFD